MTLKEKQPREVPLLVDVTYIEAEGHGNPLLTASSEVWNTGEHHRMVEARANITQESGNLQLNTEDISHVVMDHIMQLAEQKEEI